MARRSQWSESTKMIRVPISQEAKLLEIAHRLDQGGFVYSDSEFNKAISEVLQTSRLNRSDRVLVGKFFAKLRQRLKNPPSLEDG